MQPLDVVLIGASLIEYLWILPNADSLLFHKADRFFGPSSILTVQNSLDNVDAGMPLAQDIPALLSDSTTEHYNSTCKHYTSLWLAFLPSLQRGRALKPTFIAFNCTSMHCHTYTRDKTRSFQSRNASLLRALEMAPHYRGSTVDLCIAQGLFSFVCQFTCSLHWTPAIPLCWLPGNYS